MHRLRNTAINLSISLTSVLVFLALCEFVVFRCVWLASDAPQLDFVNGVIRYAPSQQGIWRVRDEIAASYAHQRAGLEQRRRRLFA